MLSSSLKNGRQTSLIVSVLSWYYITFIHTVNALTLCSEVNVELLPPLTSLSVRVVPFYILFRIYLIYCFFLESKTGCQSSGELNDCCAQGWNGQDEPSDAFEGQR
jgi:hypothetical protein